MAKLESEVNVNAVSRISAGTIIKGEIVSPYDIRIDGTFEGKVQTKGRVVIGEKANVLGDIICGSIDLWGKVDGNVYVNEQLLDETKKGQEIRFAVAPQTPQTRAEHDLVATPYSGKLRIWAWVDGTNNAIIEGDLYDASKGTFESSNTYYYPASGNDVDFIAVP